MPLMTTTREPRPDEHMVIARRMEPQRRGTSIVLRSHRNEVVGLGVMFGVAAVGLGVLLVKWPSFPLGLGFATSLTFAVLGALGKRKNRQFVEQEMAKLVATEAERARAVTEVRFAAERILVVSGDKGDGAVWWLFRGDDGKWLFLEQGQWEDLDPSRQVWNRDVRLGLDGHQLVVSIATDGPPVIVERRDIAGARLRTDAGHALLVAARGSGIAVPRARHRPDPADTNRRIESARASLERLGRIIQERRPQRVTIQFETGGAGGGGGDRSDVATDSETISFTFQFSAASAKRARRRRSTPPRHYCGSLQAQQRPRVVAAAAIRPLTSTRTRTRKRQARTARTRELAAGRRFTHHTGAGKRTSAIGKRVLVADLPGRAILVRLTAGALSAGTTVSGRARDAARPRDATRARAAGRARYPARSSLATRAAAILCQPRRPCPVVFRRRCHTPRRTRKERRAIIRGKT